MFRKYNKLTQKLLTISFQLITLSIMVICFTCETPDEWLTGDVEIQRIARAFEHHGVIARNKREIIGQMWPNGVVKYKFNHTLTLKDMFEIQKAFEEYHSKTCVRFEPWQEGDLDFISIEVDDDVCGKANVCYLGGHQFVRFGSSCRNMPTMVHELGHAFCFGHEHQRLDRDEFLKFTDCEKRPKRVASVVSKAIYDYGSQMHYESNWCRGGWPTIADVTKCGRDATSGLSVLDVDAINSMYNCQGCKRHRWIPAESLTHKDKGNMYSFGIKTKDGDPIYACRAPVKWEYAPGMFDESTKTCKVSWGWIPFELTDQVEVLTIPGGLKKDCGVYKLEDNDKVKFDDAIQAGASFKWNFPWRLHMAYATKTGKDGEVTENSIGKVWVESGHDLKTCDAEVPFGPAIHKLKKFKVLTCSLDTMCLMELWLADRKHTKLLM